MKLLLLRKRWGAWVRKFYEMAW